jgi:CDI toxin restriction endonuclease-like domain
MHQIWRLSEASDNNLGLACTEQGLLLGRTSLIERRDTRFVVRERHEIKRLLYKAYAAEPPLDRLMHGLANVAAALNVNDQCLARIAAVQLRIPDLPDKAARDELEATNILIKLGDWNPALHPRTGTSPNPGWFAPTGGSSASLPIRTAQNDTPNQGSDASPNSGDDWVRLQRAKRIDELGDFVEWLANATPEDEKAIRAEIKRYFTDVGWEGAAHDLNSLLSVVLRPNVTRDIRQKVLERADLYTRVDPAEYVGVRDFIDGAVLAGTSLLPGAKEPSPDWKLGWAKRGQNIHQKYGDPTFPPNYPVIDKIPNGVATSVKSIDLNAATYHQEQSLTYRLQQSVDKVRDFDGEDFGNIRIDNDDILGRALEVIIPRGSMTDAQRIVFQKVRAKAKRSNRPVNIIITEH